MKNSVLRDFILIDENKDIAGNKSKSENGRSL
jgi:hypothetical protein